MEIKEPKIENKSAFTFFTSIWIVPFIALIIGAWLVYEHFSKLGPEIQIEFKNSGGLLAGQSVVKFRDVPVGKITKIEINNKKEGVIVYARINKDAEAFLNETTKFWIVKPEVDYSGVKGLDTLLSGSYVKMYAKKGTKFVKKFKGLDSSFIDLNDGSYFAIEANFPVKIKKATPIYYKGVRVGEVDTISLDTQSKNLIIVARIYKEYDSLVNSSTKFWVQSLIDLKLNDNRLEVNMAPLPIMLLGGIALDTKFDKKYGKGNNKIFNLYKSASEAKQRKIGFAQKELKKFILNFKGDVSSLDKGTSIKYKGFEVGKIAKLKIIYNKDYEGFEAKCIGKIDVSNFSTNPKDSYENFKELLKKGLIAKLSKPNPLFNKSNVVLEEENNTVATIRVDKKSNLVIIPTKEYVDSGLIGKLAEITDKINKLDLEHTVSNLNEILATSKEPIKKINKVLESTQDLVKNANTSLKSINRVIDTKEFRGLSKNLNRTLKSLNSTIVQTKKVLKGYGSNSLFADKIEATLKELHDTSEETNGLLRKLNKKPNALIFGD